MFEDVRRRHLSHEIRDEFEALERNLESFKKKVFSEIDAEQEARADKARVQHLALTDFNADAYKASISNLPYDELEEMYNYNSGKCTMAFARKDWGEYDKCHTKLSIIHDLMWEKF